MSGRVRVLLGTCCIRKDSELYLSGVRNVDWSPGGRVGCICAEITVEDTRGSRLSEIYWLNLCECLQLEKFLLMYLTVHVIQ